eukprot:2340052-Rhodomonas_salina.2
MQQHTLSQYHASHSQTAGNSSIRYLGTGLRIADSTTIRYASTAHRIHTHVCSHPHLVCAEASPCSSARRNASSLVTVLAILFITLPSSCSRIAARAASRCAVRPGMIIAPR